LQNGKWKGLKGRKRGKRGKDDRQRQRKNGKWRIWIGSREERSGVAVPLVV